MTVGPEVEGRSKEIGTEKNAGHAGGYGNNPTKCNTDLQQQPFSKHLVHSMNWKLGGLQAG
jgi:hypothetical protein